MNKAEQERWDNWITANQEISDKELSIVDTAWNAQQDYINKLERIIQHAAAERTGLYFICGEGGEKDSMGLPNRILICPAYGLDGFASYKKEQDYSAPGW